MKNTANVDVEFLAINIFNILKPYNPFVYENEIEEDEVNYKKGELGIFFIIDDIDFDSYKAILDLEVTITTNKYYKFKAYSKAIEISKELDKYFGFNFNVKAKENFIQVIKEENNVNIVCNYEIYQY